MKLKKFDVVVGNIKRLVSLRGQNVNPTVSASFVVTNDNIHETVDFLRFAEFELKVDCIYIRPLSELAREFGPNEDFRSLVPYASDIRDMLDRVSDYLADVPRREYRVGSNLMRTQINVDPSAFKAMRHDPVDRVVMVKGFEDRLLPPGRNGWISNDGSVSASWNLNTMRLSFSNGSGRDAVIESARIPVEAGKPLSIKFGARAEGAPVKMAVNGAAGEIASLVINTDGENRRKEMTFNTGENEQVWLTVSAAGGSAEFDFGRVRTHGEGIKREIKLPHSRKWEKQMKGSAITWSGSKVRIQWDGAQGLYLLKSYTVPCWPNQAISWPITLEVKSGRLGVGVLSEDFQSWTHQFLFDVGRTQTELNINTGDNRRLQVVLYSTKPEPLDAEVDWGGLLEDPPLMAPVENEPAEAPATVDVPEDKETGAAERSSSSTVPASSATPKKETVKYYCQKPWTDLNNLTVDGRMDVCCIATGGTQQMYALGNIFTQEFQEIWNGPVMRNFRRTVNDAEKLPPCQRCPMAYSYQGMFFDPSHTAWTIFLKIRAIRWISRRYKKITKVERWIIKRLFKGFRVNPDGIPN
jgi:radical SAM protein with 4Fe4S-binding SPASM domain